MQIYSSLRQRRQMMCGLYGFNENAVGLIILSIRICDFVEKIQSSPEIKAYLDVHMDDNERLSFHNRLQSLNSALVQVLFNRYFKCCEYLHML